MRNVGTLVKNEFHAAPPILKVDILEQVATYRITFFATFSEPFPAPRKAAKHIRDEPFLKRG
jgi:hypothetical protein